MGVLTLDGGIRPWRAADVDHPLGGASASTSPRASASVARINLVSADKRCGYGTGVAQVAYFSRAEDVDPR